MRWLPANDSSTGVRGSPRADGYNPLSRSTLGVTFSIRIVLCCVLGLPAHAQQTGSISGKAVDTGGAVLPGVTVEARADVLPGPRETTTGAGGEYQLPALPPGNYTVTFTLSGMQTVTRKAQVQLAQDTVTDAELGVQGVARRDRHRFCVHDRRESASITSGLSNEQISGLPVSQEYRDLIRLIPAVQYTQDLTRGPSAGGSGQDNVYQFDGVNVTLPLFGTLSAEPASHDIAQITVVKGGARAVDFDRSGGFFDRLGQQVRHEPVRRAAQLPIADRGHGGGASERRELALQADALAGPMNVGGPILPERLFFYGSYYRPGEHQQQPRQPVRRTAAVREHAQRGLRQADVHPDALGARERQLPRFEAGGDERPLHGQLAAPTTGSGSENRQKIGTVEGSWVINAESFATGKFTDFTLLTQGRTGPHRGRHHQHGGRDTPRRRQPRHARAARRYRSRRRQDGVQRLHRAAGGPLRLLTTRWRPGGRRRSGYARQFDKNDFFRKAGQLGYNLTSRQAAAPHHPRRVSAVQRTRRISSAARTDGGRSRCRAAGTASRAGRSSTRQPFSSNRPARCR